MKYFYLCVHIVCISYLLLRALLVHFLPSVACSLLPLCFMFSCIMVLSWTKMILVSPLGIFPWISSWYMSQYIYPIIWIYIIGLFSQIENIKLNNLFLILDISFPFFMSKIALVVAKYGFPRIKHGHPLPSQVL